MIFKNRILREFNMNDNSILKTFIILVFALLLIIIISFCIFGIFNVKKDVMLNGIYIKGINVSGLSKEDSKKVVYSHIEKNMPDDILLVYEDYETSISIEQIEASFKIDEAVEKAYELGKADNFFIDTITAIKLLISNINVEPSLEYNSKSLDYLIENISSKLPDTVKQSSYYIEGKNLIITKGKEGPVVVTDELKRIIMKKIVDLSYSKEKINMPTVIKQPDKVDLKKIRNEIYKEQKNAYYTANPRMVYAEVNGVDFNESIDTVQKRLDESENECVVPLKITVPEVTINDLGMEAFPNKLSTFSTKYSSNADRTTNLKIAASKINGAVIMPGEEFSYNKVVGERTIAAGYKNAKIFSEGQIIDGLGGGICQISSTLYNAAVYANLEIISRRNHQFVTSYLPAGRDATVVYGSTDFKFKNNRNYPIKIVAVVSKGVATMEIYGLKEENEYQVEIESKVISSIPYKTVYQSKTGKRKGSVIQKGSNGCKTKTYKILKINGREVERELLSTDTYNAVNRIIAK